MREISLPKKDKRALAQARAQAKATKRVFKEAKRNLAKIRADIKKLIHTPALKATAPDQQAALEKLLKRAASAVKAIKAEAAGKKPVKASYKQVRRI